MRFQKHLKELVSLLDNLKFCPSHPDKKFVKMVEAKGGKLLSSAGSINAFLNTNAVVMNVGRGYGATVRSRQCSILTLGVLCSQCTKYGDALRSVHHRQQKRKPVAKTSSHTKQHKFHTVEDLCHSFTGSLWYVFYKSAKMASDTLSIIIMTTVYFFT